MGSGEGEGNGEGRGNREGDIRRYVNDTYCVQNVM
jgi:hypothetical protein